MQGNPWSNEYRLKLITTLKNIETLVYRKE